MPTFFIWQHVRLIHYIVVLLLYDAIATILSNSTSTSTYSFKASIRPQFHELMSKISQGKYTFPPIYIIPISNQFNTRCACSNTTIAYASGHESFHHWLATSYEHTIKTPQSARFYYLPAYSYLCYWHRCPRNSKTLKTDPKSTLTATVSRKLRKLSSDPASPPAFSIGNGRTIYRRRKNNNGNMNTKVSPIDTEQEGYHRNPRWWKDLDKELHRFVSLSNPNNISQRDNDRNETIILDRIFTAALFPHAIPKQFDRHIRNLLDIRYLRLDNSMTPNGRDIFVPYMLNYSEVSTYQKSDNSFHVRARKEQNRISNDQRHYFVFLLSREAGGRNDNLRQWRQHASMHLQSLFFNGTDIQSVVQKVSPKEIALFQSMSNRDFIRVMHQSDFCFVIPGDTSSTSKLYKFLFAGCIPVVFISYPSQLPFARFLDWNQFSVVIRKEVLYSRNEMIKLIERLIRMRSDFEIMRGFRDRIEEVLPFFDWRRQQWPSVYHMVLLELLETDE